MAYISGTSASETLNGTDEGETIYGFDGDDIINGFGGNDSLHGMRGSDTLSGGTGDDIYFVGQDSHVQTPTVDVVNENPDEGIDQVVTSYPEYTLPDNVENVRGSTPNGHVLIGNSLGNRMEGNREAGSDKFYGRAGNDWLIGGAGTDELYGEQGDDVFVVDSNDLVFETFQDGYDTVLATQSYKLADNAYIEVLGTIDALSLQPINLTGNGFQNLIYGNAGRNVLVSGARSAAGDHLTGYGGNDIYFVNDNDLVFETVGNGHDTVNIIPTAGTTTYKLLAGSSVETLGTSNAQGTDLVNLTGNEFQNLIYGNEGRNILTSGGGGDHLNGLGGDDIYFVTTGDQVLERADKGYDTVNADATFALRAGAHVETLGTVNASATTAINLAGNELHQIIYGNEGANVLTGGGGGDHLHGGGGNDILVEGAGADFMVGGAGSDIFQFQNVGSGIDIINDFASGADKIDLSAIDADSVQAGNNSFTFVGGNAFSGKAGELRVQMDGTTAHILGDVNGDGTADLHIVAYNAPPLTSSDFIL